jgi:hypothetical protein
MAAASRPAPTQARPRPRPPVSSAARAHPGATAAGACRWPGLPGGHVAGHGVRWAASVGSTGALVGDVTAWLVVAGVAV